VPNERLETLERPQAPARRGTGGRPTREEALKRDARLLDVATQLFMERGFEGTSIDAVAETAGISKPTVYARYRDKRELFTAVLRERIRQFLAPISAAAEAQATDIRPTDVETVLHELSRHMLTHVSTAECATLQRILAAQAAQFPELAKLAHEEGWLRAVRGVAAVLRQFHHRGQIDVDDPELAADLFLNLVLGHSKRLAAHGIATDPDAEERTRKAAVKLFLNGVGVR
jgi:TetR/AcrR family transcriptional regulator, mexJK operon transcriptional repressor